MKWESANHAAVPLALSVLLAVGAANAQSVTSDDGGFDRAELRASELLGAVVENEQGQEIGEIDDLILTKQSDVVTAVVSVGGFFGLGEKLIGVPYDELRATSDGDALLVAMTEAELEAEPSFQYASERASTGADSGAQVTSDLSPAQSNVGAQAGQANRVTTQTGQANRATTQTDQAHRTAPDRETQPAPATAQPAADDEPISTLAGSASEGTRSQPNERSAPPDERSAAIVTDDPPPAPATQAGDAHTASRADAAPSAQSREVAPNAQRAETEPSASRGRQAAARDAERATTIETMDRNAHKASELIGLTIVDSQGEEVGQVDDLVVSAGAEVLAVLSVGGLIGIGDTLVAVPLEELDVETAAEPGQAGQLDDSAQIRLAMTAEQLLDAEPEFQYDPGIVH